MHLSSARVARFLLAGLICGCATGNNGASAPAGSPPPGSDHGTIVNSTVKDSNIRRDFNLIVVAIKRDQGEMLFNPNPSSMILTNDTLIVLGDYNKIKELEKLI